MSVVNFRRYSLKNGLVKGSDFADIPNIVPAPGIITANLVRYYDAGNSTSYPGTGTTWTDLQSSGYNLTLNNGPTFNSAGAGSYFSFDGTNDYAQANDAGLPSGSQDRTFTIWQQRRSTADFKAMYFYGTANFNQAVIAYYVDNYTPVDQSYTVDIYGGGVGGLGRQQTGNDSWHMLSFTWSSSGDFKYFYDDTTDYTGSVSPSTFNTVLNGALQLAFGPAGVGYGNLYIGKFMVYSSTLPLADIQTNYNATKGDYGL